MRTVIPLLSVLFVTACADTGDVPIAAPPSATPATEAALQTWKPTDPPLARPNPPRNFSWVQRELGAMAWPGSGPQLDEAVRWLAEDDVDLVVTLTENKLDESILKAYGMRSVQIPIVDFTPPTLEQIDQFVRTVRAAIDRDQRVAVHCAGGKGRTGTMVAAWFVANGATADEAITRIRALRPGSIETPAQEAIVRTYAESR